jgi:hypothetical protein
MAGLDQALRDSWQRQRISQRELQEGQEHAFPGLNDRLQDRRVLRMPTEAEAHDFITLHNHVADPIT